MGPISHMLAEHQRLRLLLDRLNAVSLAPASALPKERWWRLLAHELTELQGMLRAHFAAEENAGYMAEVWLHRPGLSPRVDALLAEHVELQAELEQVRESLDAQPDVDEVRLRLRDVLAALAAHEEAENELVQDGLQRDDGLCD